MPDESPEAAALRGYLADRDTPCPGCGYNLRGLTSDSCPECNQALRISVSLRDSHLTALLAAILPAASIAGAAVVLVLAVLVLTAESGHGFLSGNDAVVCFWLPLATTVCFGVPSLWLGQSRGRAWFCGLSPSGRANTVTASVIASIAMLVLFLVLLVHM